MATAIDFSLARTKHANWKGKLRNFLNGKEGGLNEQQASSPKHCDLGIWLYGSAMTDFDHVFEMKTLERIHSTMHASVGATIRAKNSGDMATAKVEFDKVMKASDEIVALLTTIENKVKLS